MAWLLTKLALFLLDWNVVQIGDVSIFSGYVFSTHYGNTCFDNNKNYNYYNNSNFSFSILI